jgi:hypothetical protein
MPKDKSLTIGDGFIIGATCITGASLFYAITKYNERKTLLSNIAQKNKPKTPPPSPISSAILEVVKPSRLTPEKKENLENLYRKKLAKYIKSCKMLKDLEMLEETKKEVEETGNINEEVEPPLFDVNLGEPQRKISDDMWFKTPVSPKKESSETTDTEDEWCILKEVSNITSTD